MRQISGLLSETEVAEIAQGLERAHGAKLAYTLLSAYDGATIRDALGLDCSSLGPINQLATAMYARLTPAEQRADYKQAEKELKPYQSPKL